MLGHFKNIGSIHSLGQGPKSWLQIFEITTEMNDEIMYWGRTYYWTIPTFPTIALDFKSSNGNTEQLNNKD